MVTMDSKSTGRSRGAATAGKGEGLPFTKKNYLIFAVGLAAIVLGYITLSQGSITLAPILLVLGYCVIIPVALLYKGGDDKPSSAP